MGSLRQLGAGVTTPGRQNDTSSPATQILLSFVLSSFSPTSSHWNRKILFPFLKGRILSFRKGNETLLFQLGSIGQASVLFPALQVIPFTCIVFSSFSFFWEGGFLSFHVFNFFSHLFVCLPSLTDPTLIPGVFAPPILGFRTKIIPFLYFIQ